MSGVGTRDLIGRDLLLMTYIQKNGRKTASVGIGRSIF